MRSFLGLIPALLLGVAAPAGGQDVRAAARKAAADREAAVAAARASEAQILSNRQALQAEVEHWEGRARELEAEITQLELAIAAAESRRADLQERWSERELEFREISGTVRVAARDLETLLRQSPTSARAAGRDALIQPLLDTGYFPDIDDIATLATQFFDEIERSGEVNLRRDAEFVGRSGKIVQGDVLTLGRFLAAYRTPDETGFLRYTPDDQRFYALDALPSWQVRRALNRYLDGETDLVPVDFSAGGALRQITRRAGWRDQLRAGGPIVWPILWLGLICLAIIVQRLWYFNRVHGNTDKVMGEIHRLAASANWDACRQLLRGHEQKWPVVNVIAAGLDARREDRQTLESILQEAILRELPRLERFLSVLSISAAIAPLLGLLGTVTGMIRTFRVITLHGTGDPKLMSGGISEALITTELGLAVAIPVMLLHALLSRRMDHIVGDMEQKAIALTNIILGQRGRDADPHGND